VRITVLGKSPSWQDAGGACSGYLIEHDGHRLLLDCGNGVFAKLRKHCDYAEVEAVVISHLHADHFLDLVPFSYALTYGPRGHGPRPALHAPSGARETFRRVVGAWGSEDLIESAFELREYEPGPQIEIGALRIGFREVQHFVRTFAVSFEAGGDARFVFGADTGPSDELVDFARGADLLMVEATLADADDEGGHLSAGEAGEHARRAGARRLVLTHISDELDESRARRAAEESFGGPVAVAREGATYAV
jgi:ribonuclease BN (tRNA processing enzyme)